MLHFLENYFVHGKRNKRQQAGVTLLEVLLYVTISAAILFAAVTVLTLTIELRQKSRAIESVEAEGLSVTTALRSYFINADKIVVPASGESSEGVTIGVNENKSDTVVQIKYSKGVFTIARGNAAPLRLTSPDVVVSNVKFVAIGAPTSNFLSYTFTLSANDATGRHDYKRVFSGGVSLRK